MSETIKFTISLTKSQQDLAKELSKQKFGKTNVSGFYAYLLEREKNTIHVDTSNKFNVQEFIKKNKGQLKQYNTPGTRILTTRPPMHLKSLASSYHLKFDTMEEYINEFISKGLYKYELTDLYSAIEKKDVHSVRTIVELAKL